MKVVKVPDELQGVIGVKVSQLPDYFVGLGKQQVELYVREMYANPEFTDGVIKPTQKTTIVLLDRFISFLRYMDEQKFK